jgi:predicted nuclease of predicted toxin-antitoxin system
LRLLLDAHLSGRVVGKSLTRSGHDVRALDQEPELEGLPDTSVLELATAEGRVLVTANIRDFEPILREWAGEMRSHSGVILVPSSVRNEDFGILVQGIEKTLSLASQKGWADRVEWLRR